MSDEVPYARFKVLEQLDQGGMGTVYRAIDTLTGQNIALKVGTIPLDAASTERFMRELRHAVAVRHENVCGVIGTGRREDGAVFLAMELIDGPRLLDLARAKRAAPLLWIEVMRGLVSGLEAAHDKGIIHRDVKPSNVMFTADGTLKLLDFGIARSEADETVTSTGMVVGTAAYMSPEQARAEDVDGRSDLFSAAMTTMSLASRGATRFSSTKLDSVRKVLTVGMIPPPLLCTVDACAPPELENLFGGIFTLQPEDRVASAAALLALIDRNPVRHHNGAQLLRGWVAGQITDEEVLKLDAARELVRAHAMPLDAESQVARALALRRASLLDPDRATLNTLQAECTRGNFRFDNDYDNPTQKRLEQADLQRLEPGELKRGYELFRRTGHIEMATRLLWAYVRHAPDDAAMLRQLERNLFGRERENRSALSIVRGIKTGGLKLLERELAAGAATMTLADVGARRAGAGPAARPDMTRPMRPPTQTGPSAARLAAAAMQDPTLALAHVPDDGANTRWLGRIIVVGAAVLVALLLVVTVRTTREEVNKGAGVIERAELGESVNARLVLIEQAEKALAAKDALGAIDATTRVMELSPSVETGLRALFVRAQAHALLLDNAAARRDLELYLERAVDFKDPNIPKVKRMLADINQGTRTLE